MKPFIAVDIDDTVAETAKTVMELLHEAFGHDEKLSVSSLLTQYRQPGDVGFWQTKEATSFVTQLLNSEEFLSSLPTVPDAAETLQALRDNDAELCYITSRLDQFETVTGDWLKNNNFPEAPVICRQVNEIRHNWKLQTLIQDETRSHKHSFFIDDTVQAFEDVPLAYQGSLILFNRWQKVSAKKRITICKTWKEIEHLLSSTL